MNEPGRPSSLLSLVLTPSRSFSYSSTRLAHWGQLVFLLGGSASLSYVCFGDLAIALPCSAAVVFLEVDLILVSIFLPEASKSWTTARWPFWQASHKGSLINIWLAGINSGISQHQRDHLLVAFKTCDEQGSGSFVAAQVGINLWVGEKMFHDKRVSNVAGT